MSVAFVDEQDEPVDTSEFILLAGMVLDEEGLDPDTDVTVTLIGEGEIAGLNERYLGRSGPTDVLSFPIEEASPGRPPLRQPGGSPIELGDVFICPAVVRRNVTARGGVFSDEMALMVVHGVLHLLGWDHEGEEEAARMEARERELLARVGRRRP